MQEGCARRADTVLMVDGDRRVGRALGRLLEAIDPTISVVFVPQVAKVTKEDLRGLGLAVVVLGTDDVAGDLRGIRELTECTNAPIVAISSRDGVRAEALSHGARSFIHYGNAPEDVLDTICGAFRRSIALTSPDPGA